MKRFTLALLAGALVSTCSVFAEPPKAAIEIAICLDTSNSMDGLIDAAKQKLWAVVTDMGTAKPSPSLKVALYQYGNDGLDSKTGWVQQLSPMTDDLDTIYGKLFALKTHGGTEYVARAVKDAAEQLKWSDDNSTLRMIVVAGNEPATQDTSVKLEDACKAAASRGIVINTIFCGAEAEGRSTGWADAARLADGRFSAIDQNGGTVVIETPFDKDLTELGTKLNATYVPYGPGGKAGVANQVAQDANAVTLSPSASAVRSAGKAQGQYSNAGWDMVDAVSQKKVDVTTIEQEQLPPEMQKMSPEQRVKYVQEKATQRKDMQDQIKQLNTKRDEYVKQEMEKRGLSDKNAFDAALRQAVREQAAKKGIEFEQK